MYCKTSRISPFKQQNPLLFGTSDVLRSSVFNERPYSDRGVFSFFLSFPPFCRQNFSKMTWLIFLYVQKWQIMTIPRGIIFFIFFSKFVNGRWFPVPRQKTLSPRDLRNCKYLNILTLWDDRLYFCRYVKLFFQFVVNSCRYQE